MCPWRKVFIAVGDEWSERVYCMGRLYHRDFVGLRTKTKGLSSISFFCLFFLKLIGPMKIVHI